MTPFSITTRRSEGTTVLEVAGELDLATVPALREEALKELTTPGCATLVLDLADLSFLDSTGLGCWVELHNRATENGQHLQLRSTPPATLRTLNIAGLTSLFDLVTAPDPGPPAAHPGSGSAARPA